MMCITAAASNAKELLERAGKANVSGAQRDVDELLGDNRVPNDFPYKLQCTCRDGLGRDTLVLAAEARASALEDAIGEGYSMIREEAATGCAEGGAATGVAA